MNNDARQESIFFMMTTLIAGNYSKYRFNDKEKNFTCAVESKEMFYTKMLDSNTNVWIKNEEANEKKYKRFIQLVCSIVILLISAIICCCIG